MNYFLLGLSGILFSLNSYSYASYYYPSTSKEKFCSDRLDSTFIKNLATEPINLMAFPNMGGLFNGGVCWWHSQFQRNGLYLTYFDSSIERPDENTIKRIIKEIRAGNKVVLIPGYDNFNQFSKDNFKLIQKELKNWQSTDGTNNWKNGLKGNSEVSASELKKIMDTLYYEVEVKNTISFNILQMTGITAHAWLILKMEKTSDGYNLDILDSNFPNGIREYRYFEGLTQFEYNIAQYSERRVKLGWEFVPYLYKTNEMDTLNKTIANFCPQNKIK